MLEPLEPLEVALSTAGVWETLAVQQVLSLVVYSPSQVLWVAKAAVSRLWVITAGRSRGAAAMGGRCECSGLAADACAPGG